MRRRALVVDDEPMVAALIRDVLTTAGFEVEVAHSAAAASEVLADFDPDIAVLDIALGRGATGIDVAHLACKTYPATALLLLSGYPDIRTAQLTHSEVPPGCQFLSKSDVVKGTVLIDAVEAVLRDNEIIVGDADDNPGPLAALSKAQLAVLHLVAQGFTTVEIARRRECTTSAVEKMLGTIYSRLNIDAGGSIHPRVEAIRIYVEASALPARSDGY